uniref:Uncharacterized protein n=1 Tax=uncultured alpha proteobacterium EF100_102A06 TaxID=710799 RepID=E0Y2E9_9PROT|nr:hypothetical protein [uncultured alpha proteobacterium EF100_102A06]
MLAPSTHPFRVRIQVALAEVCLAERSDAGGVAQLGERRLCKP